MLVVSDVYTGKGGDAGKEQTLELAAEMCATISPLELAQEVLRLEAEVSDEQRALNIVSHQAEAEMVKAQKVAEDKKVVKTSMLLWLPKPRRASAAEVSS